MRGLSSSKSVCVALAAVATSIGAAELAAAAPGSKSESAKYARAKRFDGKRRPDNRVRPLPAAPRMLAKLGKPKDGMRRRTTPAETRGAPEQHKVSPKKASTSKLTLQAGASKAWHHGGVYMRNGIGWITLSFSGLGGTHVQAHCNVSSPHGPATLKMKRDGSVVTKPLAKGVSNVDINVPNAPDDFTVEMKVEPIAGLGSDDTGWMLYYCRLE